MWGGLVPFSQVGTANVSVANEVAEVQKLLRASGLTCTMHSAGTTVGEFSFAFPLFPFFFPSPFHHVTPFPPKGLAKPFGGREVE